MLALPNRLKIDENACVNLVWPGDRYTAFRRCEHGMINVIDRELNCIPVNSNPRLKAAP
jgi:hypothetical protein